MLWTKGRCTILCWNSKICMFPLFQIFFCRHTSEPLVLLTALLFQCQGRESDGCAFSSVKCVGCGNELLTVAQPPTLPQRPNEEQSSGKGDGRTNSKSYAHRAGRFRSSAFTGSVCVRMSVCVSVWGKASLKQKGESPAPVGPWRNTVVWLNSQTQGQNF